MQTPLVAAAYPATPGERDRWILSRRPQRNRVDPLRPYAVVTERELDISGELASVLTVFLTNRECPWHCVMCDLWKNTLIDSTALGAIPTQLDWALSQMGDSDAAVPLRSIKLYNSGSFFDARAIPPEDHFAIAERLTRFDRVIVECHPSLVGESALRFRDLLAGKLEVAMGLETANPDVLARLNKRMTLEQFADAARFLRKHDIDLRVFILVKPPFQDEREALVWAKRSIDFAFDAGAAVVSLIPTRPGNGAMEALADLGEFSPPKLSLVEAAAHHGVSLGRGRVFADLWDLEQFSDCAACFPARRARLEQMNLTQQLPLPIGCPVCGVGQDESHARH